MKESTNDQIAEAIESALTAESLKTRRWVTDSIQTASDRIESKTRILVVTAIVANQTLGRVEAGLQVAGVTAGFLVVLHITKIAAFLRGFFDR